MPSIDRGTTIIYILDHAGKTDIDIVALRNVVEHRWWLRPLLNMPTHDLCDGCQI